MITDSDAVLALFERMKSEGIDTSRPLRWGFFFADPAREPLERVFAELEDHGYVLVELGERDDAWVLHVTKTEVLAPDKLHRRNVAFNQLAEHCGAALYDGWDVDVSDRAG